MSDYSDRLNEALRERGQKAPWLARQVGVSKSAAYQWLDGKTKNMRHENLLAAAQALGVRTEWLIKGRGPMMPVAEAETGPDVVLSTTPIVGDTQGGPQKYHIEHGFPPGESDEVVDTPAKSAHAYALRVRGGSMFPRMREGDVVTVDPEASPMPGDEVIVRTSEGEVFVKELVYERRGEIALDSVADHEPRIIRRLDEIEFMHLVIGIHPARSVKKRPD